MVCPYRQSDSVTGINNQVAQRSMWAGHGHRELAAGGGHTGTRDTVVQSPSNLWGVPAEDPRDCGACALAHPGPGTLHLCPCFRLQCSAVLAPCGS